MPYDCNIKSFKQKVITLKITNNKLFEARDYFDTTVYLLVITYMLAAMKPYKHTYIHIKHSTSKHDCDNSALHIYFM